MRTISVRYCLKERIVFMKKRLTALLCAVAVTLSLTACSKQEQNSTSTTTANSSAVSATSTTSDSVSSATSETSSVASSDNATSSAVVSEANSATESTPETTTDSKYVLTNKNATPEAQKVYSFICENMGKKIISGQQESTWAGDETYTNKEQYEFDYIQDKTGKLPAIRGLDYMNDDFDGVNRRAKEWWEKGGIVTICWHCSCDFDRSYDECKATEITDWDKALTEGTDEYNKLVAGMDKGAKALKELADENIPVLWRPFHEFDGGWFWWGKGGAENFKKLWQLMYDRYTNHWGLNNLIWVCGFSGNGIKEGDQKTNYAEWYPGNDYVDCVGADTYSKGSQVDLYNEVYKVVGDAKPIPYHECGRIPLPEELQTDGAKWSWFMTWHTSYATDGRSNPVERLQTVYNDDYVITLDELPKWN